MARLPCSAWLVPLILLVGIPAFGQKLALSSNAGSPGSPVTLEVSLAAPSSNKPLALEWEILFPGQVLEIGSEIGEAGPTGRDAGKILYCSLRTEYTCSCILAGGKKSIDNGVVALLRFKIRATAKVKIASVTIRKASAVTQDLQPFPISETGAAIVIRQP